MKKLIFLSLSIVLIVVCVCSFAACKKQCEVCTFGEWQTVTEPTCTSEGEKMRVCTVCELEERKPIEKLEHDLSFKETKTAPTCTAEGVDVWACANCAHTEDKTVKATGHSFGEAVVTVAVTCTSDGANEKTCSVCGEKKTQTVASKGHQYGTATTVRNATCAKEGLKKSTCSVCGDVKESTIGKTRHNYSAATCTSPQTCKTCGTTSGYAKGHAWKNASCTEPRKCTTCGVTDGSALGHSTTSGKCSRCGETVSILSQSTFEFLHFTKYINDDLGVFKSIREKSRGSNYIEFEVVVEVTYAQSSSTSIDYVIRDPRGIQIDSGWVYESPTTTGTVFIDTITVYESDLTVPGKYVIENVDWKSYLDE